MAEALDLGSFRAYAAEVADRHRRRYRRFHRIVRRHPSLTPQLREQIRWTMRSAALNVREWRNYAKD